MVVQGSISLAEALAHWGASEGNRPPPATPHEMYPAVVFCLARRHPLIAQLLLAAVVDIQRVLLEPDDLDLIQAMVQPADPPSTLRVHVAGVTGPVPAAPVKPPFLATARRVPDTLTIFDGMHRGSEWARQVLAGRGYPVAALIFVTRVPPPFEGVAHMGRWPTY